MLRTTEVSEFAKLELGRRSGESRAHIAQKVPRVARIRDLRNDVLMTRKGKRAASISLVVALALTLVAGLTYARIKSSTNSVDSYSFGESNAVQPPTPLEAPTILFYGGSMTAGASAATPKEAYTALIVKAASVAGPSTPTVTAQPGVQTFSFLVAHPRPPVNADLTIVELGTNDVGKTEPAAFRESYGTLLDTIKGPNAGGFLVCVGTWANPENAKPYDVAIYDECTRHGGSYVRLSSVYTEAVNRGPDTTVANRQSADNFLPNTAGHRKIAERVASVLPGNPTIE